VGVRGPSPPRRPKNAAEGAFWDRATSEGWAVSRRGWPDFFLERGGRIALVEVKPHRGRRLKTEQRRVLLALAAYGVPCYQWCPDGGFTRIAAASAAEPRARPAPE
jgi:hypothetical protein